MAGHLVGSLFDGGKPPKQSAGGPGGASSGAHQQGGLVGMASGFLGGQHGQHGSSVR